MSQELSFTTELVNQGIKAERECHKLQALLDDKFLRTTFKWCPDKDEIVIFKRKRERKIIQDDNDEDDEDDEPEVKPKHSVRFKKEDNDSDNDNDENNNNIADNTNNNTADNDNDNDDGEEDEDLIRHLTNISQQLRNVPITWEDAPQSPWSQHEDHVEQNPVIVLNIVEPVQIQHLYTPEGVGLFF
jgi:hypothetical protein